MYVDSNRLLYVYNKQYIPTIYTAHKKARVVGVLHAHVRRLMFAYTKLQFRIMFVHGKNIFYAITRGLFLCAGDRGHSHRATTLGHKSIITSAGATELSGRNV